VFISNNYGSQVEITFLLVRRKVPDSAVHRVSSLEAARSIHCPCFVAKYIVFIKRSVTFSIPLHGAMFLPLEQLQCVVNEIIITYLFS
jgi:hypothetical protein